MPAKVHLMPSATRKLDPSLHDMVRDELALAFPKATGVTVYDILVGYQASQRRKLILAVETMTPSSGGSGEVYENDIVKLGERNEVANDAAAWKKFLHGKQFSKRMFLPVDERPLSEETNRVAVVYQSASHWYSTMTHEGQIATLAWAADRSVFSTDVQSTSVERVIRQVFRELSGSLYKSATDGEISGSSADNAPVNVTRAAARQFYRGKLKLDVEPPAVSPVDLWKNSRDFRGLRRDVDWLLCGAMSPTTNSPPEYIDPCDYVLWALQKEERIPATLVGVSHGDLHAGNVIVGLAEKEAEYPLLIDYGDMAANNAIAWDFVKFETELKVRLLTSLLKNHEFCQVVWSQVRSRRFQKLVERWSHSDNVVELTERTQGIVLAFELERRLAESTQQLFRSARAGEAPANSRGTPFDRVAALLHVVRTQAAESLGRSRERTTEWCDELDFAAAAYAVSTIKFSDASYPLYHRLFALVSGGVAAARLKAARDPLLTDVTLDSTELADCSNYHLPLRINYRKWKANAALADAEAALRKHSAQFSYSVPYRREHSLLLSKLGKADEAIKVIWEIVEDSGAPVDGGSDMAVVALCGPFLEFELLSRIGRIYKDKADVCWEKLDVPFESLRSSPASKYYLSAFRFYRNAFEISREYYPGGNAAVTGLLAGAPEALQIAKEVEHECRAVDVGNLSPIDHFWLVATEGDMRLIHGDVTGAASCYQTALRELPAGNDGIVQSSYIQLCRLYKVFGNEKMGPVLDAFRKMKGFHLQPGPLGDCGGLCSMHAPAL